MSGTSYELRRGKLITAIISTLVIVGLFIYASPVKALTIGITEPTPKTLGEVITFSARVEIQDSELLPMKQVDLEVYNQDAPGTYNLLCADLPLEAGSKTYSTAGGTVEVEAAPEPSWGYNYGYTYTEWQGYGYNWGYGYGYGYQPGVGTTYITYNVTWNSLATWPAGTYEIRLTVKANGDSFSKVKAVDLTLPAGVFIVNATDDTDDGTCDETHCSLREAINAANSNSGLDTIAFNIPGSGPHTIQPMSALPTITDPVVIDGYTQAGSSPNTNPPELGNNAVLKIDIDGSNAGALVDGLCITAGDSTIRGLVINSFSNHGIALETNGSNVIEGNFIGTDVTGTAALGNSCHGIAIWSGSENTIGGIDSEEHNIIAFNGGDGVLVVEPGTGNAILSNSIFSNTGLGINLGTDGVTPNDLGDGDTGANNLQNFPVITSASSGSSTIVKGTLNSTPNTDFRLEFFSNTTCDPSGHGEGETFLGSTSVTTDNCGDVNFSVTFQSTVPEGYYITATATDPNNNTSEFSRCLIIDTAPPTVVSTSPVDGATDVPVDTVVTATFCEAINEATIVFTLDGVSGSVNYSDTTATFMPDTNLDYSTSYIASINASDLVGNPMGEVYTWSFTTEEPPAPPVADFSAEPTVGVAPLKVEFSDGSTGDITSWSWDFGDTETSDEQNPSHTYTTDGAYTVSLTVTGPGGTDTETKDDYITVSERPTAVIARIWPSPATEGKRVVFSGYGIDPDGHITVYNWRSSIDGQLSTRRAFVTRDLSAGTHTIYFKVMDIDGVWSEEVSRTLEVLQNQAPTAHIRLIRPSPATEGKCVIFMGHGTDPDGRITGYNWRSSIDGQLSTHRVFTARDLSVGTHTIYFKVMDNDGAWSEEVSSTLKVKSREHPPWRPWWWHWFCRS